MKRVLKSFAIGLSFYLVYQLVVGSLMVYWVGGDVSRIRTAPPFDIASRLPTVMLRYLFPEQVSDFYKPGFTSQKIALGALSFLMNVVIFSIPPYLFLWWRDRSKRADGKPVDVPSPPPPPSFD